MRARPEVGRLAGPDDEDAVYRRLLGLADDNTLGFPHDEGVVRRHLQEAIGRRMLFVIDNPEVPGELAAGVCLGWGDFWYGGHYLAEQWLFVRPEFRKGTGFGDVLMNWTKWIGEALAEAAGQPMPVFSSVTSRKRLKAKGRWWARRGELVGLIYLLK
jgi:hypothetical protein